MNINLPNKAVIGAVVIAGSTLLALGTSPLWGEKLTEASTLLSNDNARLKVNPNQWEIAQSPPYSVHLGFAWYWHNQGMTIEPNDRIQVQGSLFPLLTTISCSAFKP